MQGVGFRWWTRSHALRLGITGTVRNREDGSVEIRARGPAEALSELRRLLDCGPPGAAVTRVDETEASDVPSTGFQIIR